MFDYLLSHALKNVWCTPDQDNQVIIQPARITPINGVWNDHRVLWTTIKLPEPLVRFHLFQIGQIHPLLLNLFPQRQSWVSLASACIEGENIVDLYTASGLQLCRAQTWYMLTKENNILLAVKQTPQIPYDFNADALFLRLYSNEYYASQRSQPLSELVDVQGGIMASQADILSLQSRYLARLGAPGGMYCFVNGYKAKDISLTSVKVGDVAEFVFDSAIARVIDFKISELPTFDSTLDHKGKYLLHYAGGDASTIDFLDDIDVFVVDALTQKGVYVHKNAGDTLRMLSHRDYAIPVAYLSAYLVHFRDPVSQVVPLHRLYVRLHVRKSGYQRELVLEHHRLNELYKLADADLVRALLGVNANVPVWRAEALEHSAYPLLMRSPCCDIDNAMVQAAYGYNAVAKLVADTPSVVSAVGNVKQVAVPYLLASDGTAFEYDAQGLLLEYHVHTAGRTYLCKSPQAHYVEILSGQGGPSIEDAYGSTAGTLDPAASYRFYTCPIVDGVVSHEWRDVTGTTAYTVGQGEYTWLVDPATTYTLVRSDRQFLLHSAELAHEGGVLGFDITQLRGVQGQTALQNVHVPLGELDLFLNGHSLIEGLDYHVEFPRVVIVNKRYLVSPESQAQRLVWRHTGFCNERLERTASNEFGFLQHGKISVNNRFDIHDGKVLRIVAGGRLQVREELTFSETDHSYTLDDADNGAPYLIRDIVVPLKRLVNENTYTYRAASLAVDQAISDYLTLKLPEDEPVSVNPIASRHALFSPFLCAILYALQAGLLEDLGTEEAQYADMDVRRVCGPWEYLLRYDPIHAARAPDADYVEVHPHFLSSQVDLSVAQYRFLAKAVRIYGGERASLSLSAFARIV